jgi:hypothetical protein
MNSRHRRQCSRRLPEKDMTDQKDDKHTRHHLSRYAGRKIARRLTRSIPFIGGVLVLATVGAAIRRKGFFGGTLDTALDFIPFVGGTKNLIEAGRGRDFIPERAAPRRREQLARTRA